MARKLNWKDLAGTAKQWLDQKTTETVTTDRRTRESAAAQQDQLGREMQEQAGTIVLTTMFPSLGRAMERQEQQRLQAEQEHTDRARSRRLAAVVPGSSVELTGHVTGRVDDLAVTLTPDDDSGTLTVLLEPVDAAPLSGGAALVAAGFAITGYHGDDDYQLVEDDPSLEPGVHHVALAGDDEGCWFYWIADYGPGTAVVRDGRIVASIVCDNAGSERITATMTIPLP